MSHLPPDEVSLWSGKSKSYEYEVVDRQFNKNPNSRYAIKIDSLFEESSHDKNYLIDKCKRWINEDTEG